jgi:hypothetical protein
MHRFLTGLAMLVTIEGCESPSAPVARGLTLTPSANVYSPGVLIPATLANASEIAFTYGDCHPRLERLVWRRWVAAAQDPRACTGIIRIVPAESGTEVSFLLASDIPAGTYRLRLDVRSSTTDRLEVVRSRRFSIVEPD